MVAPREVLKTGDVRQKLREEEVTARTGPRRVEELAAVMGQLASGPPKEKRRVVVDDGARRIDRREKTRSRELWKRGAPRRGKWWVDSQRKWTSGRGLCSMIWRS